MLESITIAYVGDSSRGLDIVQALDQRLQRPVHLVGIDPEDADILEDQRLDAILCGLIEPSAFEGLVDAVRTRDRSIPIVDLSGQAPPVTDVSVHRIETECSRQEIIDSLAGKLVSVSSGQESYTPRPLSWYVALDESFVVTDWDPRLEEATGVSPEQAVGTRLWELLPEWQGTELAAHLRRVQEHREATKLVLQHDPLDTQLAVRCTPTHDGGIECFLYEQQSTSDNQAGPTLERTLERITDAFFALDPEDRFVLVNSKAEEILDVQEKDVLGVRFWDAFPAAMSTSFYTEFNEAMDSQEPTSFEEYYRPQDSWLEVTAYPSEDGLSVFLRDVTEQVELQQKLEALHEVTRELIVAESDTAIAERTVRAAEEILDFPLVALWRYDDVTAKLDPLAYSTAIDDRVAEMKPLGRDSEFIWEVYEESEPRKLGFVPATTSTSHHPGKVTSELLVPVGEYGVIAAYADERDAFDETDTELFRLLASTVESAFARTKRERQLARQNERLHDFASVVSHDLRNPLNVASAHAELARDGERSTHLDKIEDSLERMEALIEDLLARARGDQELDPETLSLESVAHEAWQSVETAEATLDIEQAVELDADRERLRQLFENCFRNAVEHAGEDVSIRVGTHDTGFFIADDGPGISADHRDGIFEQGVSYGDGTGYGLAIVADIVEGHGWSIEAVERDDGGARFDISNVRSQREC